MHMLNQQPVASSISPPTDTWHCLETFLVLRAGQGDATGIRWVEARDTANRQRAQDALTEDYSAQTSQMTYSAQTSQPDV